MEEDPSHVIVVEIFSPTTVTYISIRDMIALVRNRIRAGSVLVLFEPNAHSSNMWTPATTHMSVTGVLLDVMTAQHSSTTCRDTGVWIGTEGRFKMNIRADPIQPGVEARESGRTLDASFVI